jgi:hypothetical protein
MKTLYLLFIALAGLLFNNVEATGQVKISGKVLDRESKKPISNVHVIEDSNNRAVITDSLGRFSFDVLKLPALISVSHLSYHPQAIIVDRVELEGLTIELLKKNVQINEIVIVAEKLQQFFKKEVFYVREMEFGEGMIWVIGNPDKNSLKKELRILGLDARTSGIVNLSKPASLFKDAYGEVYLDSQDSLNQLYWNGEKIGLHDPFIKDGSEEFIYSLQTSHDSLAILKLVSDNALLNEFLAFDFRDSSQYTFHYSFDHELYASSKIAKRYKYGSIPDVIFPPFGPVRRDQANPDPMGAFVNYAQDRLLTFTPVNSRLYRLNDEILIFEDKGPFIWKYNLKLGPLGMVSIKVPDKSYHVDLLQDPVTQFLFVVFDQQGRHYVSQLDPLTGELIKTIRIEGFTFVENLRIYGNRIYYLDQSRTGKQTMNLYSLKLE